MTISHAPERIRKYGNLSQSRLSVSGSSTFISSIIREGKSLQAKWKQSSDKKHVLPFRTRRNVATLRGQPLWLPQARGDSGRRKTGQRPWVVRMHVRNSFVAQWVKDAVLSLQRCRCTPRPGKFHLLCVQPKTKEERGGQERGKTHTH